MNDYDDIRGDQPPKEIPEEWLEAAMQKNSDVAKPFIDQTNPFVSQPHPYVQKALDDEIAKLAGAVEGTRNSILNEVAFALGQFVGGGELHEMTVRQQMERVATDIGLERDEIIKTMASGLSAGKKQPRRTPGADEGNVVPHPSVIAIYNSFMRRQQDETKEAVKKEVKKNHTELPEITADSFFGKDVPVRKFHDVKGLIPCHGVTLLYGDGGTGKSLLALQLAAATSAGKKWLGTYVQHGPVYYFSAEDSIDEAHIRLDAMNNALGSSFKDMRELHIAPMVGHECVLASDNGKGIIKPTSLFEAFKKRVQAIQPVLVIIDNAIDVFAGDQNSGPQVKQFMQLLSGFSIENNCPILLLAHPSKAGMNSGTGDGGSVHWSNSARSRLYLTRIHTADENNLMFEDDPCARRLSNMKANYSPTGIEIKMRWEDGCFAHDKIDHPDPSDKFGVALKAERVFMLLLEWHLQKGLHISPNRSSSFAPAVFARHAQSEGIRKIQFEIAMNSLLQMNKIRVKKSGPPSRKVTVLDIVKEGSDGLSDVRSV